MTTIRPWDDPALVGYLSGRPAAIVAPGPSYDSFPREALTLVPLVALNAAVTEVWRNPHCVWACHDIHKIWRDRFEERIQEYKAWTLLTRRVVLPGKLGDGPYRAVGGGSERGPFEPRLSGLRVARAREIRWYSELENQKSFLHATETVLEIALEALTLWGASPVVLVGVDLQPRGGESYAKPWRWKPCKIKGDKFAAMRRALEAGRKRWGNIVLVGDGWKGCPFERVTPEDGAAILSRAPSAHPGAGVGATPAALA